MIKYKCITPWPSGKASDSDSEIASPNLAGVAKPT